MGTEGFGFVWDSSDGGKVCCFVHLVKYASYLCLLSMSSLPLHDLCHCELSFHSLFWWTFPEYLFVLKWFIDVFPALLCMWTTITSLDNFSVDSYRLLWKQSQRIENISVHSSLLQAKAFYMYLFNCSIECRKNWAACKLFPLGVLTYIVN